MIYTRVKVFMKEQTAAIDRPIYLYRGDKNVEVQFELIDSLYKQYKYDGPNVIDNLGASYGQLVIQKPDYTYMFSDITATNNGIIIFTIPSEMVDEEIEVGAYTFQIRLYSENQESRVTLPPVKGGIILVEPIASEDDNTVQEGMIE